MKVYREGKEIFEIKDYKQVGSFMNVATIEATVKTPTPFVFKVGDYVIFDYNGLTYTLYNVVPEKKQARSGTYGEAFIYELKFKADTEQLAICPFLDLVANDNGLHYTSLPSFSTYENIYGIAARLQANMDYLYPNKWRFNVVDTTDEALMELLNEPREFSISGESCFDGLKKIYDIWGVSFIHTFENGVNVITIGKSAGATSIFRYGKGQGLRTIKKNIQNVDQLCTRAYVYGSTRNIPALWYNEKGYIGEAQYAPNLMIPPSKWIGGVPQGAYIDAIFGDDNRIEKYGLRIKTLNYDGSDSNKDEICPSIEKVTAYDIRKAKEELGQTTLVPSASYADNERMDYILEGSNIDDDGIGSEAGYVIYSDKIFSDIQGQYKQISIGELMPEGYYKPVAVQKSMTLCSFEVTKTANYRISEIVDLVTFQKNESRSIVSASLILQKPSGEYISLGQLSFSDKIKGSLKLSENGNIDATEAGTYSIVLKFNVSWDSNAILPESVGGITLDYSIKASTVTFSRGLNILSNFFEIKIKQIGFNLNDVTASGQFKTIHIKSGMCAGRSFNITQCKYSESDDSWVLTCRRIIDNSISQRFPNNIFPIAKDDQFILLNIHMPDIYIHTAMQRLYNTALADLRHLSKPQYVIEPEIDNIQMARSPQTLKEGMYMPIEDADISYIDDTLIDSVTITNKEKELRTFQVTLRSDKIINTFSKLASRISDLESSLQEAESKANISQAQDNDDSKINEGNTGGGSSTGLDTNALKQYLDTNKYITETALEGYATTDDVTELSNSVSNLRTDFDNLNNLLNDDTSGVIDTWNEVVDFLNGYKESEDLATILSKMNEDIAKRVLSTDFNSYKTTTDSRISVLESLGLSIVVENGKTYLKSEHSFFTEKDIFAGGLGEEGPSSGGIIQQVYGASAFGGTFDANNLTDTFNAHAINSLYTTIQRGIKNPYALTINGTPYDGSSAVDITISGGTADSIAWDAITGKPSLVYYDTRIDTNTLANSVAKMGYGYATEGWYESGPALSFGVENYQFQMQMRLSAEISSVVWRPVQSGTKFSWRHFLDAYNYSNYALPKSGGTITGKTTISTSGWGNQLVINRSEGNGAPAIAFSNVGNGILGYIGIGGTASLIGTNPFYEDTSGNTYPLLHSGNIGSHKAGDSAKLGGIDADRYMLGHNPYAVDADYIFDLSYHSVSSGSHLPSSSQYGSLLTMPYRKTAGNSTPDFGTQIFIPNGDDAKPYMWFRTSLKNTWNSWRKVVSEEANGNVLIGTTEDKGYKLDINGGSLRLCANVGSSNDTLAGFYTHSANPFGVQFRVNTSSGNTYIQARREGKAEYFNILLQPDGGNVLIGAITDHGAKLQVDGNLTFTGDIAAGSDARYKSKLQDIAIDVATIANAPLFSYKWNNREDKDVHLGTTAQYWMDTNFRDAVNINNPDFYHLNYGALGVAIGVSVAKKVVNHEEEIRLLKGRVNELENELKQYRRLS